MQGALHDLTGQTVMNNNIPKRSEINISTDKYYRSLTKSLLLIGVFLPLVPMLLVSGVMYYQFNTSYKNDVRAYLIEVVQKEESSAAHRLTEDPEAFSGLKKTKTVSLAVIVVVCFLIVANAHNLSKKIVRRIVLADKEKQRQNEQMFQTGKLASIGELATGIAHEINNPVAIMVEEAGWIDDLLKEEDFKKGKNLDEFKRAINQIRTQGIRCKEITHKLLHFARKTDFTVQEVDLNNLLQDIITIAAKKAKHSSVIIDKEISNKLPLVKLSSTELQQVFLNLVNNALDAMEENGGTLYISAKLENGDMEIEVSDNGPGISKEDLPRIFDPFFTTKPVGKGTGLGLSICYGIVKKLGGEITVNSKVNKGTTFRVRIPLKNERKDDTDVSVAI